MINTGHSRSNYPKFHHQPRIEMENWEEPTFFRYGKNSNGWKTVI